MKYSSIITKLFFAAALVFAVTFSASAQKFGHLNSAELMSELPSIKSADSELQTYQQQLAKIGEDLVTDFQKNYQDYQAKVNTGTLSQIQAQEIEASLQQEQQSIQVYQQEVQRKVTEKRKELYDPIFDKVRNVIEQYGKDNGYTMIFDSGLGAILFESSEDLTEAVRAKL
ncbi:OmpH family outer membrane protein [Portibacter lacus]|uniref:Membrane protein n=1 Tax=Portibacter lacus TaxID=1099794 RepID=A0AA37STE3_9BACT|nr:OmpH family outer membrane protein [Portibacter lacus]GLR17795.1 membrane protein [Portibacter lacus]